MSFSQVPFFLPDPPYFQKRLFSGPCSKFRIKIVQSDPYRQSEAGIRVPGKSSREEGGGGMLIILNFTKLNKLCIWNFEKILWDRKKSKLKQGTKNKSWDPGMEKDS